MDRSLIADAVDTAMADAMPAADNRCKVGLSKALLSDALDEIWGLKRTA